MKCKELQVKPVFAEEKKMTPKIKQRAERLWEESTDSMWSLEDRTFKEKYTNSGLRCVEVCILSVTLADSVTLSKSLNLAGPQFPCLYNFSNNTLRGRYRSMDFKSRVLRFKS